jgi:hypothetical protein
MTDLIRPKAKHGWHQILQIYPDPKNCNFFGINFVMSPNFKNLGLVKIYSRKQNQTVGHKNTIFVKLEVL